MPDPFSSSEAYQTFIYTSRFGCTAPFCVFACWKLVCAPMSGRLFPFFSQSVVVFLCRTLLNLRVLLNASG